MERYERLALMIWPVLVVASIVGALVGLGARGWLVGEYLVPALGLALVLAYWLVTWMATPVRQKSS